MVHYSVVKITLLLTLFIFFTYLPVAMLSGDSVSAYIREDGIVEYYGALCFFLSFLTICCFIYTDTKENNKLDIKRNWFIVLLGLFFLICFLEEISWGQRVFNVDTPVLMKNINSQNEINLHNIIVFTGNETSFTKSKILVSLLDVTVLFHLFCLMYCLVIPLLCRGFKAAKDLAARCRIPVVPVEFGVLFGVNFALSKLFKQYLNQQEGIAHAVIEIKEANFAMLFFVICVLLYYRRSEFLPGDSEC